MSCYCINLNPIIWQSAISCEEKLLYLPTNTKAISFSYDPSTRMSFEHSQDLPIDLHDFQGGVESTLIKMSLFEISWCFKLHQCFSSIRVPIWNISRLPIRQSIFCRDYLEWRYFFHGKKKEGGGLIILNIVIRNNNGKQYVWHISDVCNATGGR
jgi:hypothetical protein